MVEQDGVTLSQIEKGIHSLKTPEGHFWKRIILSTQKFREKIPQLILNGTGNSLEKSSISDMRKSVQKNSENMNNVIEALARLRKLESGKPVKTIHPVYNRTKFATKKLGHRLIKNWYGNCSGSTNPLHLF